MDNSNLITSNLQNGFLSVIVKPNSPKTKIIKWDDSKQSLRIAIAAPPDKDKANRELIKFLETKTNKKFRITRGSKQREKRLKCLN